MNEPLIVHSRDADGNVRRRFFEPSQPPAVRRGQASDARRGAVVLAPAASALALVLAWLGSG